MAFERGRSREAKAAIADHEEDQRALHSNRERLRAERFAREEAAGPMLYPAPELPDNTPIDNVRFSTRILNALIGNPDAQGEAHTELNENLAKLEQYERRAYSRRKRALHAMMAYGD